jgi:RNA polymerase-binding transcription factor DksA
MSLPASTTDLLPANSAFTLADLAQSEQDMAGVEQAIAAMDAGTYARCAVCNADLAEAVKVDPLQRTCSDHLALA